MSAQTNGDPNLCDYAIAPAPIAPHIQKKKERRCEENLKYTTANLPKEDNKEGHTRRNQEKKDKHSCPSHPLALLYVLSTLFFLVTAVILIIFSFSVPR
jgi:hypothetical protein